MPEDRATRPAGDQNEKREGNVDPVDRFANQLIRAGIAEIKTPEELDGRKFVLTYRTAKNLMMETPKIDRASFIGRHAYTGGFTDIYALDLFEEISHGSEIFFVPVGHRDYTAVKFSDSNEARASGNFATKRSFLAKNGPLPANSKFNPYELADRTWGGLIANGIDVLGSYYDRESHGDVRELRQVLTLLGIPESQSWKGHDFGKLLMALGLELLKREGIKSLDMGILSPHEITSIFTKLFKNFDASVVLLSNVRRKACRSFIGPFIVSKLDDRPNME